MKDAFMRMFPAIATLLAGYILQQYVADEKTRQIMYVGITIAVLFAANSMYKQRK